MNIVFWLLVIIVMVLVWFCRWTSCLLGITSSATT